MNLVEAIWDEAARMNLRHLRFRAVVLHVEAAWHLGWREYDVARQKDEQALTMCDEILAAIREVEARQASGLAP